MKKSEKAIFALPTGNDENTRISSAAFWFTFISMRVIYESEMVAMTRRLKESTTRLYKKLSDIDQEEISKILDTYTLDLEDKIAAGLKASELLAKDKGNLAPPDSKPYNPENDDSNKNTLYNRLKKLMTRQEKNEDKLEETRRAYMKAEVKAENAKRVDKKEPDAVKKAVALERKSLKAFGKYKQSYQIEQEGRKTFLDGNRAMRYEWLAKTQTGIETVVKALVSFFGNLNDKENPEALRHHYSIGNIRYDEILDILENLDAKQMTRKLASQFKDIHAFPVFEEYCPDEYQSTLTEYSDFLEDITVESKTERRNAKTKREHDTGSVTSNEETGDNRDVTVMSDVYVLATDGYKRKTQKEISLKAGMQIKQKKPMNEDGFAYGWTRTNNLAPKKYGFYPAKCVTWYRSPKKDT